VSTPPKAKVRTVGPLPKPGAKRGPKPAIQAPPNPGTTSPWMKAAKALTDAQAIHWRAQRELSAAIAREHDAEAALALLGLQQYRGGIDADDVVCPWLVHWWNNGATSPRQKLGHPCVMTAAEIPGTAEPLVTAPPTKEG
jgi:hypothetical protein